MSFKPEKPDLLIYEYNGTARSGKGTIVSQLAAEHPEAAVEETGIDYRSITRWLLSEGLIDLEMSPEEIGAKVEGLGLESLSQTVANRSAVLEEYGLQSLYVHDVNEAVAAVAKVEMSRQAVKDGFRKRVEAVRDMAEHQILLVDGRDLAKVLKDIANTRLLLRTFVTCSPVEAARRECLRSGVETDSPAGKAILASIDKRTQTDAQRAVDPVKPDSDGLDYWHPPRGTAQEELGGLAVRLGKQIYFDTTAFARLPDSKQAMLEAAEQMFSSALSEVNQPAVGRL